MYYKGGKLDSTEVPLSGWVGRRRNAEHLTLKDEEADEGRRIRRRGGRGLRRRRSGTGDGGDRRQREGEGMKNDDDDEDDDAHDLRHNNVSLNSSPAMSRTRSSLVDDSESGVALRYAPSALTRRVAGGMLRPNDSLIDLAMLPVPDNTAGGGGGGAGGNDYLASVFSRDDSLVNFLAAGYGNGVEDEEATAAAGRACGDDAAGGGGGWGVGMGIGGDGNVNTFGFIDFKS
jgi:hypothetical protein